MVEAENTAGRWWDDRMFRSVTLYPWATMDAEAELKELAERGVDTIFVVTKESDGRVFYDSSVAPNQVPSRDLLADIVEAATIHDVRVVPLLFVLCDKHLVEEHPETVQVAREGTDIRYPNVSAEWMHWVCPRYDVVRDHNRAVVDEVLEYDVDGVQFTDFEYQPIRNGETSYRSCFCDACLEQYDSQEITDESDAWVDVRCETVTSLLEKLTAPVHDQDGVMVSVELEAFADLDTASENSREMLGVDQHNVATLSDVLSPRAAHVDLDMHPIWIRDTIRSLRAEMDTPIVPSIRTARGEEPYERATEGEFVTSVQMALHGGAHGVSLFSAGANVGRITPEQWAWVERMFEEMTQFEREYGLATEK